MNEKLVNAWSVFKDLSPRQMFGVGLLIFSTVVWLALPVIPFLPVDLAWKALVGTVVFVVAEVTFYIGLAMMGKEAVDVMKRWWESTKRFFGFSSQPE